MYVNRLFWHCPLYFSPSNLVEDALKSASKLLQSPLPFAAQYSLILSETSAGHNPKSQEYEVELEGPSDVGDVAVNSGVESACCRYCRSRARLTRTSTFIKLLRLHNRKRIYTVTSVTSLTTSTSAALGKKQCRYFRTLTKTLLSRASRSPFALRFAAPE